MRSLDARAPLAAALLLASLSGCPGPSEPPEADGAVGDAAWLDAEALDAETPRCEGPPALAVGDEEARATLPIAPGRALAGRIDAGDLPSSWSGLSVYEPGDFLLANEHVAILIEDRGPSDLYDPWGGRPVGLARVEGGRLVDAADFGEFFVLVGRATVLTESVSVMNDGADGEAAVVRAVGWLRPVPFFESLTSRVFPADYTRVRAAIDYVLEPGSHHVDIRLELASGSPSPIRARSRLHGFLYSTRTPPFVRGAGFGLPSDSVDAITWVDDRGVSYTYDTPGQPLGPGLEQSGFVGRIGPGFVVPACTTSHLDYARLTIGGGRGLDAALAALDEEGARPLRAISGVVREADGSPAEGVTVFATDADGVLLTRSLPTGSDGRYLLHVGAEASVRLSSHRRGARVSAPIELDASATSRDLAMDVRGFVHVRTFDADALEPLPARISVFAADGTLVAPPPAAWGVPPEYADRVLVEYAHTGEATLPLPEGRYRVVVSRGFEYEVFEASIAIEDASTHELTAVLEHVVDTTGVLCGDFHIHTRRSADAPDEGLLKVRGAVADGVELPVRSDHEYISDFSEEIAALGVERFAFPISSTEMTSLMVWGHAGVFPLDPIPGARNRGAPLWQEYPEPDDPDRPLRTMEPPEAWDLVRARPERPTVIINHPMGATNYFDYVGYDPVTGLPRRAAGWDTTFTILEVFNGESWVGGRTVPSWLGLLDHGRRVFAVGSSDSHKLHSSPVGYPRTCVELDTDDPRTLTAAFVRDRMLAGRMTVSGGIFVDAWAAGGTVGPGGDATVGSRAAVRVRVQAASWVDVDALDVVVDGRTVDTIEILPTDADPSNPAVRFDRTIDVDVAGGDGSYVIFAAYGDAPLEPMLRGELPFGVTNPIFLH